MRLSEEFHKHLLEALQVSSDVSRIIQILQSKGILIKEGDKIAIKREFIEEGDPRPRDDFALSILEGHAEYIIPYLNTFQ